MSPTSIRGRHPDWHGFPRLAALLTLAAALAGCGGSATKPDARLPAGPDPAAVSRYQEALGLLQAGDAGQAERQLQSLVDAWPDYSGPMVNLAMIRARRQELEPAAALLKRAVTVCERCAAPWNELGVVQRQQGQFADAEQSYLRAIAADAAYANARFNLAVLYELYLQRPDMALDQYSRFRELTAADPTVAEVDKWITDLQRRTAAVERSAQLEAAP